jgi:hypothetical protein
VTVDVVDGSRQLTGRAAQGEERDRLRARWQEIDENLDSYAGRRSIESADLESRQQIRSEDNAGRDELTDGGLTP